MVACIGGSASAKGMPGVRKKARSTRRAHMSILSGRYAVDPLLGTKPQFHGRQDQRTYSGKTLLGAGFWWLWINIELAMSFCDSASDITLLVTRSFHVSVVGTTPETMNTKK